MGNWGKAILVGIFFTCTDSSVWARICYYHPDHLGSLNTTTEQDSHVVESTSYTPFGETSYQSLATSDNLTDTPARSAILRSTSTITTRDITIPL
jgi:hypothetical protein